MNALRIRYAAIVIGIATIAFGLFCIAFVARASGPIPVRYSATGSFHINGEFPATDGSTVAGERWASWGGSDAQTGTLTSTPFRAPRFVALKISGGTAHPDQQIEIVGPDGSERISFRTPADIGETYVTQVKLLPPAWYHRLVRLRATDAGGGVRGWIGIGDLRAAGPLDFILVPATWFATHGWAYSTIILLLMGCLTSFAIALPAVRGPWTRMDTMFIAGIAVIFFWMRWPLVIVGAPLNPDEAQTTAQAIKALFDFGPWHGFDGTTSGPLNSYVLAIPGLFGVFPTLVSTHVIGSTLVTLTCVALFAAGRTLWGSRIASCAVIAFVELEALTRENDFLHTSSEVLPDVLLAGALWAFAAATNAGTKTKRMLGSYAAAGILAGAIPLAKLQTAPSAVVLCAAVVAILYRQKNWSGARAFLLGLVFVPLVIVAAAAACGALRDAYVSYVVASVAYVGGAAGYGFNAYNFAFNVSTRFRDVAYGAIGFATTLTAWFAMRRRRPERNDLIVLGFLVLLIGVTFWEATTPRRPFGHYLALVAVPLCLSVSAVAAIAFKPRLTGEGALPPGRGQWTAVALASLAFFARPALEVITHFQTNFPEVIAGATWVDGTATEIERYAKPGDRAIVWGWAPELYDYTGTVMATRDCCSLLVTAPGPLQAYFRKRYLADFAADPPVVIVDAVAPGRFTLVTRATQGIETFPGLYAIILKQYRLVREIAGVRIWERRRT